MWPVTSKFIIFKIYINGNHFWNGKENNYLCTVCVNYTMRSFMTCTPHQISSERPNQEQDGRDMWHIWERGETYTMFWREPWKKSLGRSRRRSDDNNKMCLQQMSWNDVDWIDLTQDKDKCRPLVNGVSGFIKCWTLFYSTGLFSQS